MNRHIMVANYQAQAAELLNAYTTETGHLPSCPAEALTGIIRMLGWGLKFQPIAAGRWAECDRLRKRIRIASNLPDLLEHPEQAKRITHGTLAHEIGHAMLHSQPRHSRTVPRRWEWEAYVFSATLLCPWRLLAGRPEIDALRGNMLTMRERWGRVGQLADDLQVTSSFMVGVLSLYGILEKTPGGGIQAPYDVIVSPARPWKKAA